MESEFCAMLHFLFPDELLFLYADADDAGLSGGSSGDQYGKCGDRVVQLYNRSCSVSGLFRVFWWIAFRVSLYIFSPSSFLLSCSAGI